MALAVMDSSSRYGLVSRALHWGMALLFVWQFSSAVARVWLEDTAIEGFLWGGHSQVGVVLMALVMIRAAWAVMNASRRPPAVSVMAKLGHVALYGLMIVVPAIALIRQYGLGRALDVFGLSLMSGGGERIERGRAGGDPTTRAAGRPRNGLDERTGTRGRAQTRSDGCLRHRARPQP